MSSPGCTNTCARLEKADIFISQDLLGADPDDNPTDVWDHLVSEELQALLSDILVYFVLKWHQVQF